jgi:DNA polymerase-3 subunit gamma/tau
MSYQVLARKWRPRRFSELVGQGHVVRALVNALDSNRLHHAFLFTGTRGVGKTTIARILAKSLNCESGVSAQPCGTCKTCVEVDEGRFVDLIEVDAASRTKVDDTRELLDNVQYAPTRGRYKVYLVDEVHMLSGHSFNALLKTLEEPPPHVKFLLATTDPQKLPVTILSRCLQFNLKRLEPDLIADQLRHILEAEAIPFEPAALALLSRAADGSMRDGLSLLDQAIVFGGGQVHAIETREMLGGIDQDIVERLMQALANGSTDAVLRAISEAAQHNIDYDGVLKELMLLLHRVALLQFAPASSDGDDATRVRAHAQALTPEDVQLFYQIALTGRRDLPLAPDPRTGLEMVLLRMLAFRPPGGEGQVPEEPRRASVPAAPTTSGVTETTAVATEVRCAEPSLYASVASNPSQASWSDVIARLRLSGLVRELANNAAFDSLEEGRLVLTLDPAFAHLQSKERITVLQQALAGHYGREIRLEIRVGSVGIETPSRQRQREHDERQQAAVETITNDPNVRALQEQFNARISPGSIRPKI